MRSEASGLTMPAKKYFCTGLKLSIENGKWVGKKSFKLEGVYLFKYSHWWRRMSLITSIWAESISQSQCMTFLTWGWCNEGQALSFSGLWEGKLVSGRVRSTLEYSYSVERHVLHNNATDMWQGWLECVVLMQAAGMTCDEGQRLRQTGAWRVTDDVSVVVTVFNTSVILAEEERTGNADRELITGYFCNQISVVK